jgi:hypothetical protein
MGVSFPVALGIDKKFLLPTSSRSTSSSVHADGREASMVRDSSFADWYDAPPWAESSEPDDQAVIHSRRVGSLVDLDGGELAVDVVRRDDLSLIDGVVAVLREPAWVRVAGVRIALDQAVPLARMLESAKALTEPSFEADRKGPLSSVGPRSVSEEVESR